MSIDIFKQLKEISEKNITNPAWLVRTRVNLRIYMATHARQGFMFRFSHMFLRGALAGVLLVVFLLSATGVTLASQYSIPGDTLYPWKVGIENIESVFIISSQTRATFE